MNWRVIYQLSVYVYCRSSIWIIISNEKILYLNDQAFSIFKNLLFFFFKQSFARNYSAKSNETPNNLFCVETFLTIRVKYQYMYYAFHALLFIVALFDFVLYFRS